MGNYDDYDPNVHRSRVEKKSRAEQKEEEKRIRIQKEVEARRQARREKHASQADAEHSVPEDPQQNKKNKQNKKGKRSAKKIILTIICIGLIICLIGAAAVLFVVSSIIKDAPEIETDNIYSLLSQSSTLYDDEGNVIDSIFSDKNRTLVEIGDIPKNVKYAFISLEDKTFETHHGFNFVRIIGAIVNSVKTGDAISGTSTITQQLARNLYMEDIMSQRSLTRKITEAYYAVILEKKLTKDQILEAYLNTVNFGCGYGIQTAAQSYFSKDVSEITLYEAACLAALPNAPSKYALVLCVNLDSVTEDQENLLYTDGNYAYIANTAAEGRAKLCLKCMLEQEHISQEEYDEAIQHTIPEIVNPSHEEIQGNTNYFADFVIETVIQDFMDQYGYDREKAYNLVYNGGLNIYTTLNSQAQSVVEKEFLDDSNFPVPTNYSKDSKGNILVKDSNAVLLYKYSNYIEKDGTFKLKKSEYTLNEDGSLTIKKGKRLAIYETKSNGVTDYSVELKNMYIIEDNKFYSINGGYLSIPASYKSLDKKGNVVVSAQFFTDYPSFFVKDGDKLSTENYTLRAKVIQPQSAMTIIDNATGQIKAMVGGRKIEGRLLFNRATATRQPGSSIKPIAVYSAALQRSLELEEAGKTFPLTETGFDNQGTHLWGDYITAASIVDDEPMTVNGEIWPKNSYKGYRGLYTFRTALQQSVNVCAVKILAQVGVDYAFEHAKSFGLTTLVGKGSANDVNLAALGMGGLTNGVSTLEMASAYTTFVNDGIHKSYTCYTQVTNRSGAVLLEAETTEEEVLDPGVAWIMRDILQTVVSEGIGSNAKVKGEKVGGKTGTTSDSFDIWFDGFTANYTAALWIGNDVNIKLSSMSQKAALLWSKVMGQIDAAKGGKYSSKPENVVSASIDTKSGLLEVESSITARTEYFTRGTMPTKAGSLYDEYIICSESGYLATPACPYTEEVHGIKRPYPANEKVGDADDSITPYYCNCHNPDPELYPVDPDVEDDVTIMDPIDDEYYDDEFDDPNYDPESGTVIEPVIDPNYSDDEEF